MAHSPPAVDEWTLVAYRPGIGPESVVTSINGMSGDIELDPLDLGCVSVDPQELTDEQQAQVRNGSMYMAMQCAELRRFRYGIRSHVRRSRNGQAAR